MSGLMDKNKKIFEKRVFQPKDLDRDFDLTAERGQREKPQIQESSEKEKPDFDQAVAGAAGVQATTAKPLVKDEKTLQIENILAEDMEEMYKALPPAVQKEFKIKGEEAANKIAVLMSQVKFKFSEILEIIKDWLRLIPGINKFFVEQEAKIKTDRILNLNKNKNN